MKILVAAILTLTFFPRVERSETPAMQIDGECKTIKVISLEGNSVDAGEVLNSFSSTRVGSCFSVDSLHQDLDRARVLFYSDLGFLEAQFREPRVTQTGGSVEINLQIDEGSRFTAGNVIVRENAAGITEAEIRAALGLEHGHVVSGFSAMQKALGRLEDSYKRKGHYDFAVSFVPSLRQTAVNSGVVDFDFDIEDSGVFSFKQISIVGCADLSEKAIARHLRLRSGDIYDPQSIAAAIHNLNSWGKLRPLDAAEDVEIKPNNATRTLDVVFRVRPKSALLDSEQ